MLLLSRHIALVGTRRNHTSLKREASLETHGARGAVLRRLLRSLCSEFPSRRCQFLRKCAARCGKPCDQIQRASPRLASLAADMLLPMQRSKWSPGRATRARRGRICSHQNPKHSGQTLRLRLQGRGIYPCGATAGSEMEKELPAAHAMQSPPPAPKGPAPSCDALRPPGDL